MKFVVLDTETASLDGGIVELAFASVTPDLRVIEQHCSLIDPERPISPAARGVHGISDADVYTAPTLREYMHMRGQPFASPDLVVIAHNAPFDRRMLADVLPASHKAICTLKLARLAWPELENHKLQTLRWALDIEVGDAHRAAGDVNTTLGLLGRLCEVNKTDLHGLLELSSKALPPTTLMSFGKHKGTALKDLPKSYVSWLLDPVRAIDPDLKQALQALR